MIFFNYLYYKCYISKISLIKCYAEAEIRGAAPLPLLLENVCLFHMESLKHEWSSPPLWQLMGPSLMNISDSATNMT